MEVKVVKELSHYIRNNIKGLLIISSLNSINNIDYLTMRNLCHVQSELSNLFKFSILKDDDLHKSFLIKGGYLQSLKTVQIDIYRINNFNSQLDQFHSSINTKCHHLM